MSMSLTITSSSEDINHINQIIKILDCLKYYYTSNDDSIFKNNSITLDDISSLQQKYNFYHNILTTSGMSLEDYQDSLSS